MVADQGLIPTKADTRRQSTANRRRSQAHEDDTARWQTPGSRGGVFVAAVGFLDAGCAGYDRVLALHAVRGAAAAAPSLYLIDARGLDELALLRRGRRTWATPSRTWRRTCRSAAGRERPLDRSCWRWLLAALAYQRSKAYLVTASPTLDHVGGDVTTAVTRYGDRTQRRARGRKAKEAHGGGARPGVCRRLLNSTQRQQ